ncbi:hypothetical protein WA026_020185 [Henosepilachna vigintioctopunctata]|uniref:Uncharacterized protein n=1 Tax=Henosepilachna vigintioctopunctata TaxID=420089 RepID=A0AAW1UD30_9CUCU
MKTHPTSGTYLDNIFSNLEDTSTVVDGHISDHCAVKFVCREPLSTTPNADIIFKRSINEHNINSFLSELSNVAWDDVYSDMDDIDRTWMQFLSRFSLIFQNCFTMKKIRISKNRSFHINPQIKSPLKDRLNILRIMSQVGP